MIHMSNYFSFSWMFDWMFDWMSGLSQTGQIVVAIISLGFIMGLILLAKKHEKVI